MNLAQAITLAGAVVSKDSATPTLGHVRIDPSGVWATDRYMLVHVPAENIESELPDRELFIPPTMLPIVKKQRTMWVVDGVVKSDDGNLTLSVDSCGGDYPNLAKLLESFSFDETTESDTVAYRLDLLNRLKPQLWGDRPSDVVKWTRYGKVMKLDIHEATVIYLTPIVER